MWTNAFITIREKYLGLHVYRPMNAHNKEIGIAWHLNEFMVTASCRVVFISRRKIYEIFMRFYRKTQHTLIDLQKHADGNQQTVVGNSYHNNMFVNTDPPETIERQGDGIPYEIVGRPQTNELFYQRTNGTLYAYAGQAKK